MQIDAESYKMKHNKIRILTAYWSLAGLHGTRKDIY